MPCRSQSIRQYIGNKSEVVVLEGLCAYGLLTPLGCSLKSLIHWLLPIELEVYPNLVTFSLYPTSVTNGSLI